MMSYKVIFGYFLFLVVCATHAAAITCGQTKCDADAGGYCCPADSSTTVKDCCCTSSGGSSSKSCEHHSSFPTWAGVLIGIVVVGIIGGVIGGVIFIRRRRQASMPYASQS